MDGINEIKVFLLGENTGIFQYIYNNFIWPDGFKFIFGVGINIISSNKYNVNSDIGYVNYFWTGGLIYCVFINAFYFGLLVLIKRKLNNNFGLFLFIYLMSIIIIFAFKMPLLSNNEFVTLVFLLFVFFTFDKKKQKT